MYNYNSDLENDGSLKNPKDNYGSIMRAITTNTDFDASNIEYVEFWMLDPFQSGTNAQVGNNTDGTKRRGELTFDLGIMTEDCLEDNLQSFENGLPAPGQTLVNTDETRWGKVTRSQHITNAFVNTAGSRSSQDVGLDGLDDNAEQQYFANNSFGNNFLTQVQGKVSADAYQKILTDPSADNFKYYLGGDLDAVSTGPKIIDRYKYYNGHQGNSPEASGTQSFIPSATQMPDNEDLNGDNTVSNTDSYYSYKIKVAQDDFYAGTNYIVDKISPAGQPSWYLFRIPIRDVNHPNFAGKTGSIDDFKTIRLTAISLMEKCCSNILRLRYFSLSSKVTKPVLFLRIGFELTWMSPQEKFKTRVIIIKRAFMMGISVSDRNTLVGQAKLASQSDLLNFLLFM
jgi:cell surface protein SprA